MKQLVSQAGCDPAKYSTKQVIFRTAPDSPRSELLTEAHRQEVLEFLQIRPVHTVVMTSFIRDNGMEGADNRGQFYGCRDASGTLTGIALIGHVTLLESESEEALVAFADIARRSKTPLHVLMSDGDTVERFWKYYADKGQQPKHVYTELLFELAFPFIVRECEWEIRPAQADELLPIAEAHAEVAFAESGIDPLLKDREGFLRRCLKRIEMGRTFIVTENGKLVFKADIAAQTDEVIYLEGIYVAPDYRGQSVGSKCLSKLSLTLLEQAEHISLLCNVDLKGAHRSYLKAGYANTDSCQTIFV